MMELEVYAAGLRDLNKILQLDHQLEAIAGLRYRVDSNNDLVYFGVDKPRSTFVKFGRFSSGSDAIHGLSAPSPGTSAEIENEAAWRLRGCDIICRRLSDDCTIV